MKVTNTGSATQTFRDKGGKLVEIRAGETATISGLGPRSQARFDLAKSMGVLSEASEAPPVAAEPQSLDDKPAAKRK